jgi:hypothetical protein
MENLNPQEATNDVQEAPQYDRRYWNEAVDDILRDNHTLIIFKMGEGFAGWYYAQKENA